jgi:hypothetical protein
MIASEFGTASHPAVFHVRHSCKREPVCERTLVQRSSLLELATADRRFEVPHVGGEARRIQLEHPWSQGKTSLAVRSPHRIQRPDAENGEPVPVSLSGPEHRRQRITVEAALTFSARRIRMAKTSLAAAAPTTGFPVLGEGKSLRMS